MKACSWALIQLGKQWRWWPYEAKDCRSSADGTTSDISNSRNAFSLFSFPKLWLDLICGVFAPPINTKIPDKAAALQASLTCNPSKLRHPWWDRSPIHRIFCYHSVLPVRDVYHFAKSPVLLPLEHGYHSPLAVGLLMIWYQRQCHRNGNKGKG